MWVHSDELLQNHPFRKTASVNYDLNAPHSSAFQTLAKHPLFVLLFERTLEKLAVAPVHVGCGSGPSSLLLLK